MSVAVIGAAVDVVCGHVRECLRKTSCVTKLAKLNQILPIKP
jgi:hypothetical protein